MSRWAKATSRSSTNLFFGEFPQSVLRIFSATTRFSSSLSIGPMILERSNLPTIPRDTLQPAARDWHVLANGVSGYMALTLITTLESVPVTSVSPPLPEAQPMAD